MSRSRARRMVTSSPSSRMRPPVGSSSPAIILSVVVLPQPDGPSMTKNSPSATTKLKSWTATNDPKSFFRFSTRISAMAIPGNFETTMNMTVPASMVTKE